MIKHNLLFRKDPSVATKSVDDVSCEDKTPADALNEDDGWDDVAEDLGDKELLESDDKAMFLVSQGSRPKPSQAKPSPSRA